MSTECAGNASARSSSTSPTSSSLQWLADTGATSHMTPHRHWVRNYTPLRVPIKLADNSVVYSAGVGTVVFNPLVGGKEARPVEFSRVLHVPALHNNLLSCLYLTKHKDFEILITQSRWLSNAITRHFSALPFRFTTLLSSMDTRYHTLNQQTLLQHFLSLHHSGIVAAATMAWLI